MEKIKCRICGREFRNINGLSSHLSNKKSSCYTNVKEYYDKYIRKDKEGICIVCGKETGFTGLNCGYPREYCFDCKNKNPKTIEKTKKVWKNKKYEKLKNSGYFDLPEACLICNKKFKDEGRLAKHLSEHKITPKEYYDTYIKTENEGICSITGRKTSFLSIKDGYCKFSGKGTNSADKEVQDKKEKTLLKNYGVTNACNVNKEDRILSFMKTYEDRRILKNTRLRFISILRKLTINKEDKSQCQICGIKFITIKSLGVHLHKGHHIRAKRYYDTFFKKEGEGICENSGKKTKFNCIERGYYRYHPSIVTHTKEIKRGAKEYQLKYIKTRIINEQHMYNVEFPNVNNLNKINDMTDIICLKCNNIFQGRFTNVAAKYTKCPECYPRVTCYTSIAEMEILDYIKSIIPDKILNNLFGFIHSKRGHALELDILIKSRLLAIEHDGLYYHSELCGKGPKYHIHKTKECMKKNIRLIHIFEDEWIFKRDIIKSILSNILNNTVNTNTIYARKCEIYEIEPNIKNEFLEKNHLLGKDHSKIKLGAFYNGELVSVMTFSRGNVSRGGNPFDTNMFELSRFCSKLHTSIPGIASKFLSYFRKKYTWNEIYSYADLRWSNGDLYHKLGFKLLHQTPPDYSYVYGNKRIHRYNLRKNKYEPKEVSEWVLRSFQGYSRMWDCGKLKFGLRR